MRNVSFTFATDASPNRSRSLTVNVSTVLATLVLLSASPLAQESKAIGVAQLIANVQSRRDATDFRANGRLVRIGELGQRTTYQFSMKARSFADVVKIFCEVKDPAPARVRLLLESRSAGRATIRIGHAGDDAPKELPFERWREPLLASDFSYEDLMEGHFLWQNQSLINEEKYGARDSYVIKSEPGSEDRSHYSAVTSWLDREIFFPIKVEKVMKASGIAKEFIYYGLRQSKGMWSASQIEVRNQWEGGSTLLIITCGSEKANLNDREFDPALLIKRD